MIDCLYNMFLLSNCFSFSFSIFTCCPDTVVHTDENNSAVLLQNEQDTTLEFITA